MDNITIEILYDDFNKLKHDSESIGFIKYIVSSKLLDNSEKIIMLNDILDIGDDTETKYVSGINLNELPEMEDEEIQ